jgi:hypothetical protein
VGQGYHFGRPKTAAEMLLMLEAPPVSDKIAG